MGNRWAGSQKDIIFYVYIANFEMAATWKMSSFSLDLFFTISYRKYPSLQLLILRTLLLTVSVCCQVVYVALWLYICLKQLSETEVKHQS